MTAATSLELDRIRADFPCLDQEVNGRPLVYLDNASSAQKPRQVIESMRQVYERDYANIHRGQHSLSMRATAAYEQVRGKVARFLGTTNESEIIFTSGTTAGINLVAQTWGRRNLRPGDEIVLSEMEHHSNIVPWQLIAEEKGAQIRVIPMDDRGQLDLEAFAELLGPRCRMVAVAQVSNSLGTINPVAEIIAMAHRAGARVLIDGAQAAPHLRVDVRALDCDFYVFSAHKTYGPTGTGALYGKMELLEAMPPWQGGGDMIDQVSFTRTTYNVPPMKFEAGTPNIAGVIGMGAALDWMRQIGLDAIAAHEHRLLERATAAISEIEGIRIIGTAEKKASVLGFWLEGAHPHDIGAILDQYGVAIRAGHHCAQPVMQHFGLPATARASFAVYNTEDEIATFIEALRKAREFFA
ncbi:MAG: cysteine desulfurase [Planctomycetes bacterium]|nr:cysteine desulfurase [Planctomycetota bacterium]